MTAHDRFDENTLRADIVKVWGEYGAHILVFDHILAAAQTAAMPDDALVDLLVERGVLEPVTLPHGNHTTRTYQRKN